MFKKFFFIFSLICLLFGCSKPKTVGPKDIYQIDYPNKFVADLPSPQWHLADNSRELTNYSFQIKHFPRLVNIYLKKDSGSLILVRTGRRAEFGIPSDYELTDGQLIYLTKLITKGDIIEHKEFKSENPLLERVEKIFRFQVEHPQLGTGQITAVMVHRGELLLIEFFAPKTLVEKDEPDFLKFLESLKERKKLK